MLDISTKLTCYLYNGSYNDYSNVLFDPARENQTIVLDDAYYLYVGHSKPLNQLYIDLSTVNTNNGTLTIEYYKDSWKEVTGLYDDTRNCTRNGFIQWDYLDSGDIEDVAVNSVVKYWYRISTDTDFSAGTAFNHIGLLFADDQDLKREHPNILDDSFLEDETNHLLVHISVRDNIVQYLRNKGYYKIDDSGYRNLINCWDLFDVNEVKQAATYLALAKIFLNVSDGVDDVWATKSTTYYNRGIDLLNKLTNVSIDTDDDGFKTSGERLAKSKSVRWSR